MNIRNIIAENKLADFGKIEPEKGTEEQVEKPIESFDEPLVQPQTKAQPDDEDDEPNELQISRPRFKKRKLLFLVLFLAVIGAVIYIAMPMPAEDTPSEPMIEAPLPPSFIDAGEPENKALKEDAEAKKKHVNVFEFDINNCLQTYSDAECIDLFDKNLQINE